MSDTSVLIYSYQDDPHATTVEKAANDYGLKCSIHSWHEVPTLAAASFSINADREHSYWRSARSPSVQSVEPDVVWSRRFLDRPLPEEAHKDDVDFIALQTRTFQRNWLYGSLRNARWINPPIAASAADCKMLQLSIAHQLGISLPSTLVSNDPQLIRDFYNQHANHGVIAKPLAWFLWHEGNELFIPYTSEVHKDNLRENLPMQMCPMIYQSQIRKDFELRITILGDEIIPAKLLSQTGDERTSVDTRDSTLPQDVKVEPYTLPKNIEEKLRALVKKLDLSFAQIDMAVTPLGEHIFFEVNEAGQWLWIEERCPDIKLLSRFISFCWGPESLSEIDFKAIKFAKYEKHEFLDQKVKALADTYIPQERSTEKFWPSIDLNSASSQAEMGSSKSAVL